jgi:hypothetical protein
MNTRSQADGSETAKRRRSTNLPLGRLVSTPGAIAALAKAGQDPLELIKRHRAGDWGEVAQEDSAANSRAVDQGERILSPYRIKGGVKPWIITEADRSATTILLPEEY